MTIDSEIIINLHLAEIMRTQDKQPIWTRKMDRSIFEETQDFMMEFCSLTEMNFETNINLNVYKYLEYNCLKYFYTLKTVRLHFFAA